MYNIIIYNIIIYIIMCLEKHQLHRWLHWIPLAPSDSASSIKRSMLCCKALMISSPSAAFFRGCCVGQVLKREWVVFFKKDWRKKTCEAWEIIYDQV